MNPRQQRAYDDVLAHVAARRRKRRSRTRRAGSRSILATFVLVLVGAFLVTLTAGGVGGAIALDGMLRGVDLNTLAATPPGVNTRIYDRNGKLLEIVASTENRTPVASDRISPLLKEATVAIEDRRFYEHGGVDWQGVMRAALDNLQAGHVVQGGSTIEQQLVRNLYLTDEQTFTRKVREAYLAMQMSQQWSKDKILSTYINIVPYGPVTYGCEAAALQFFSVHCKNLTLPQAALLAGLPQAPTDYDPFVHKAAARVRRDDVLAAMLAQGYISEAQYQAALGHGLGLHPGNYLNQTKQGYFVSYVRSLLNQAYSPNQVVKGGLAVTTTIDQRLQAASKAAFKSELGYSGAPSAALVAIDPRNGQVLAMNASTDYRVLNYNLPVQGTRQAGSTFKTFGLTAAIADLGIDPYTVQFMSGHFGWTDPTSGVPWTVDSHQVTNGGRTLQSALVASDNTVFARLAVDITPQRIRQMAYRLGIPRNRHLPDVPSIVLGTGDVAPLDMTHAFATLAAQGVRRPLQAITKVQDVVTGKPAPLPKAPPAKRVIPDGVAYEVSKILQDNLAYGTGAAGSSYMAGRVAGGKTGTTDNNWDAWFCGYTTSLAACVWVGYPQGAIPMSSSIWGGSIPVLIWAKFMQQAFLQEGSKFPIRDWPLPRDPAQYRAFHSQFPIASVNPCGGTAGQGTSGGKSGGKTGGGTSGGGSVPCPPPTSGKKGGKTGGTTGGTTGPPGTT
ncbi:MAG: transglycosylase domain-containing protein [Gaiellales bacterium]